MDPASETLDGSGSAARDEAVLEAKHKVFLSHSGAQKNFVEQLCVDLKRYDRYPFFDKRRDSLGIGQNFPEVIFRAIRQCQVGVVILSEEFFTRTKWPMLELAAMVESKKVIMPVFLGIKREECRNVENHKRWESVWLTWEQTNPRIDVEKWKQALSIFGPTNGLIYKEVLGEVKFREEIVEAICEGVPAETRWDDSHVQGRSRLCQVIREKVKRTQVSKSFGIRVIGLYGVGGLGKTTICKTLCNDYFKEFQGRVAHVEFESDVEVELMRGVLRKLTDTRHEVLARFDRGECTTHLKAKLEQHDVLLAIDNVSDTNEATEQARVYLRAGFKQGSVVILTSRSMEVLKRVGLAVEDCVKMPKLDASEARLLFLNQVVLVPDEINPQDEAHIARCVELCRFWEGNESGFGYLPLALKLLGIQSSTLGYDPRRWVEHLPDNSNNVMGSVFEILRRSFDALGVDDKLLFMDVVLYYPGYCLSTKFSVLGFKTLNIFEWLRMVHQGGDEEWVKSRLQELLRKSVIEELDDCVGVHDLWREFAIKETKAGDLDTRRWVYMMDDEKSGFDEVEPSGIRWGKLRRMQFIQGLSSKVVNLTMLTKLEYCSNVTVLHLKKYKDPHNVIMLDLTPLKCLKSLMLEGCSTEICGPHRELLEYVSVVEVRGLGTLKSLGLLYWIDDYISSTSMEDIACLTSLEYLGLYCRACEKLPDLSNLTLLRVVQFDIKGETCELSGLSSKLTSLQRLILKFNCLSQSNELATLTCHGISNLMALEELGMEGFVKVEEVFNFKSSRICRDQSRRVYRMYIQPPLSKLTNLQKLVIRYQTSITTLEGLSGAVSLQELEIACCSNLRKLPHTGKFTNLRILKLWCCGTIQSLPGLGELVALEVLEAVNCYKLSEIPDLRKLSKLRRLELQWCAMRKVQGVDRLEALESFSVGYCIKLIALPELCGLRNLRDLDISNCSRLKSLHSLESLNNLKVLKGDWQMVVLEPHMLPAGLEELTIVGWTSKAFPNSASLESRYDCRHLDQLNSLPTLPGVYSLMLEGCNFRAIAGLINCTALRELRISFCHELEGLPDLPHLKLLHIKDSDTKAVINMGFLPELDSLYLEELAILTELSDLSSCCPHLTHLSVCNCEELQSVTSSGPLTALEHLSIEDCGSLRVLPDLRLSTKLEFLGVWMCGIKLTRPKNGSSDYYKSSWPDVEWEALP